MNSFKDDNISNKSFSKKDYKNELGNQTKENFKLKTLSKMKNKYFELKSLNNENIIKSSKLNKYDYNNYNLNDSKNISNYNKFQINKDNLYNNLTLHSKYDENEEKLIEKKKKDFFKKSLESQIKEKENSKFLKYDTIKNREPLYYTNDYNYNNSNYENEILDSNIIKTTNDKNTNTIENKYDLNDIGNLTYSKNKNDNVNDNLKLNKIKYQNEKLNNYLRNDLPDHIKDVIDHKLTNEFKIIKKDYNERDNILKDNINYFKNYIKDLKDYKYNSDLELENLKNEIKFKNYYENQRRYNLYEALTRTKSEPKYNYDFSIKNVLNQLEDRDLQIYKHKKIFKNNKNYIDYFNDRNKIKKFKNNKVWDVLDDLEKLTKNLNRFKRKID